MTDTLGFYSRYIADEREDEIDERKPEGWRPETLADVDWMLERIGRFEREEADLDAMEAAAVARIAARKAQLAKRIGHGKAWFTALVSQYAHEHRAELLGNGKAKSRSLLHGRLSWRKAGGKLAVTDEAALKAWASRMPIELGLTKVEEKPRLKEIREYADAHALIPDGMTPEPETEEFTIKTTAGELPAKTGDDHE